MSQPLFHPPNCRPAGRRAGRSASRLACGLAALLLALPSLALAAIEVDTVGGGPIVLGGPSFGFIDGDTLNDAQFHRPSGAALGPNGRLYVADRDNGAVRVLDIAGNLTSTFVRGLQRPVGVAVDAANNIYVANNGDGTVRQFDVFGNPGAVYGGLGQPMAITLDSSTNIYVAEFLGSVMRVTPAGVVTTLATGLIHPRGIALTSSGLIAVSVEHSIQLLNPATRTMSLLAGSDTPGFTNGPPTIAKFNTPQHLASAPNGTLVVADRLNHRVRLVDTNGAVSTLYGVDTNLWSPDFPGWEDGTNTVAAAHDPIGVTVARDGTVFATEVFYHIIRKITGASLALVSTNVPGGGDGGTNVVIVIPPPAINPNSGYFPMGQEISVSSASPAVYYTTDGSEPTTNSTRLLFTNNLATIAWRETLRDLTSLRVKAFEGTNSSDTVGGLPASLDNIGVTRNLVAGIGSTVVVPVVVNLRTNAALKSIQFRAEVTPLSGVKAVVSDQFRALSISTNDFIPLVTSSEEGAASTFNFSPYLIGSTRGMAISFIGTKANFAVEDFGVVAMLAVPIPPTAKAGDTYRLSILEASGTVDGQQTPLEPALQPNREILIANVPYLVGDSALAGWYNAGDFGNGDLKNNDVNNVFNASFGLKMPYPFSDLFNAMDAFPPDTLGSAGGDGQVRFLDWQVILQRSLRLDAKNWQRAWANGGVRVPVTATLPGVQALQPAVSQAALPGNIWYRQALVGADNFGNVEPNSAVGVPVYVTLVPGASLSGLQFRAAVTPQGNAPLLLGTVEFVPAIGVPVPVNAPGVGPNEVAVGWGLDAFSPPTHAPLVGSNVLGTLRFRVPITAAAGACYTVSFSFADGAPDLDTQYEFETRRGCVYVLAPAPATPDPISDDWRVRFFGRVDSVPAGMSADPDGDGMSNLAEYLAGTHPMDPDPKSPGARLQLLPPEPRTVGGQPALAVRWLSASGRAYVVESTDSITAPNWTVLADNHPGDGQVTEVLDSPPSNSPRFYRLRLAP
ncbi:MAG: chitobiase/beta-hexosaminidase C-terminal domain-containing protein [Verrucomicrobia bacterium]|nr:chitobiase/beta-hexosaminidase C-terminal domain-containing protein [Verrucomicrobiota bacterium]